MLRSDLLPRLLGHLLLLLVVVVVGQVSSADNECWYDYLCSRDSPGFENGFTAVDSVNSCYNTCQENSDTCRHFFYQSAMGTGKCHHLSECYYSNTAQPDPGKAASGPNDCEVATSCPKLSPGGQGVEWFCAHDVDPYAADIPQNTICTTSCEFWRTSSGELVTAQSTCSYSTAGPVWTPPHLSDQSINISVATPDKTTYCQSGTCQPTFKLWYDPNKEPGAVFYCTLTQPSTISSAAPDNIITIPNDDECKLFCDDYEWYDYKCSVSAWNEAESIMSGVFCYREPAPCGSSPDCP